MPRRDIRQNHLSDASERRPYPPEGDWDILQKYTGFEFDDNDSKAAARTEYENMMYLERPGCNLCMGNQEKAAKGDTVMATSTRQPAVGMPRRGIRSSS